ncbi:MAG: tRNA (pseudouridine(54)-N(1))-methyltransferase TrmY [Thermoplasmata archaeon]
MRRFIVVGHDAVTSGDFSLDDLAGAAGRLDIMIRCVNSAFMLSHGLRADTELYLCLLGPPRPPKVVRLSGTELRYLSPDERSTGALIRKALGLQSEGRSTPGIYVRFEGLNGLLKEVGKELVYLREDGEDLRTAELGEEPTFLLSDHRDLTEEEEEAVMSLRPKLVSVGPLSLHADHCIVIVHNELDRRGL